MAVSGHPGQFGGSATTSYPSIGAVQKQVTSSGHPGLFGGSATTSYINIGAIQKAVASVVATTAPTPRLLHMGVG